VAFFVVPFVAAVLVGLASWFSFRYGRRIGVFLSTRDLHDLERSLSSQRALWQMIGVAVGTTALLLIVLVVFSLLVG
jgi:hypothetical protein